jgi:hypothetical protein
MINNKRIKWLIERYTPRDFSDADVKYYLRRELGFEVTEDIIVNFFTKVNGTPEVIPELLDCEYPKFMEYLLFYIHTTYLTPKDEDVFISRTLDFIVDDSPNNYEDDLYEIEFYEHYYLEGDIPHTLSVFVKYLGSINRALEYIKKFVNQHEMDLFRSAAQDLKQDGIK